jgi:tetratricopeptide (TPR) repeat protein
MSLFPINESSMNQFFRLFLAMLLAGFALPSGFGPYLVAQAKPASSFADLARRAEQARNANQPEQAVELYQAAVKRRRSWVEGWWYLGGSHYALHQYTQAHEAFRQVTLLNPKNGAAWAFMGLCEYELGRYGTALKSLDQGGRLGFGENKDLAPLVLYHVALLLNRSGDFERSLDQFALFVAAGNHSPDVVAGLGLSTLRMPLVPSEIPPEKQDLVMKAGEAAWTFNAHNVEDAKRLYSELVAAYPREPGVHYAYGMYLLDSDPPLAFEEFKKELEINPSHLEARLQVAFFDLQQGSPEDALAIAEDVFKVAPKDYRVHLVRGRSLLQMDQAAKATQELKIAAALVPGDSEVHFYLAQAYRTQGDQVAAAGEQALFDRLKREDNRQTSAGGWGYFAGQYYQKRRFPEARDAFRKITDQNPDDATAWAMMGLCDYELADYSNALEHMGKARHLGLQNNPDLESALHYYLALLLNRAGKFDDGLKELSWFAAGATVKPQIIEAAGINALRMTSLPSEIPADKHDLVMEMGQAAWALNLGQKAEAKRLFAELVAAHPEEPGVHYRYGICLSLLNDPDAALREFQREMEINSSDVEAQSQIAFVYLKLGAHEKGLQAAEAAVKMAPDNFLAHNVLGWALVANHQLDRAIGEMALATRLAPDAPVTHYSLAQAYKAAGKDADARREMAKFEGLKKNQSQNSGSATSPK